MKPPRSSAGRAPTFSVFLHEILVATEVFCRHDPRPSGSTAPRHHNTGHHPGLFAAVDPIRLPVYAGATVGREAKSPDRLRARTPDVRAHRGGSSSVLREDRQACRWWARQWPPQTSDLPVKKQRSGGHGRGTGPCEPWFRLGLSLEAAPMYDCKEMTQRRGWMRTRSFSHAGSSVFSWQEAAVSPCALNARQHGLARSRSRGPTECQVSAKCRAAADRPDGSCCGASAERGRGGGGAVESGALRPEGVRLVRVQSTAVVRGEAAGPLPVFAPRRERGAVRVAGKAVGAAGHAAC